MNRLCASYLALAFLLMISGMACQNATGEGVVAHKSITGARDGKSSTVLTNRPSDEGFPIISVDDRELRVHFANDAEHALVGDSLAFEIESRYDRVDYLVNIRLGSSAGSGTQSYRVSREVFNQLLVGEAVKFKSNQGEDLPEIRTLIESN